MVWAGDAVEEGTLDIDAGVVDLVWERECRTSEAPVIVVVEGRLGLEEHRSPGALAAVEGLALDSLGLEGRHIPGVLLVAWSIACSWTVEGVT